MRMMALWLYNIYVECGLNLGQSRLGKTDGEGM